MAENAVDRFEFLDHAGVEKLAKGILDTVNTRIAERITLDVSSQSDDMHTPSAAAVYRAIINSRHLSVKVVTGNINEQVPLETRRSDVIYWQRDSLDDTKWMIYIWNEDSTDNADLNGTWICLGDTEVNLDNYWSKSDADVASMKYVLGINDINRTLADKADATDLDTKVDESDLVGIPTSIVQTIIDQAIFDTEVFYTTHTLTINWLNAEAQPIAEAYTAAVRENATYNVIPPVIDGFTCPLTSVTGTMGTEDKSIDVVYDAVTPTEPEETA